MRLLKCKPNHALGNWIQAWLNLIDNVVMILSFGYIISNLTIWWIKKRFDIGLYGNGNKKQTND